MLAWILYVIMVTLLLSVGAFAAERAARLRRGGTRWIWITAILASLLIPTLIASVSVQLPNVVSPQVTQKIVVLRHVTTQALSPVTWISGSAAEPTGWRDFNSLMTLLWRCASAAMLLGIIVSGVLLFVRKRHWRRGTVLGTDVYITDEVGPAVVGLLRPRIVVPRWVTMSQPSQQAAIIAHEQSHLDACDPQLFTFALALLVFMPWNLPLWWQLRRLRYAIEVDCDARVLKSGMDPAQYGETLIAVGERQSAYIGAVAAMSESQSFLEERIRIMISKPVKWRRVGIATLAGLSLALTVLAAQVSPPNAVDSGAAPSTEPTAQPAEKAAERVAIKLPANVLDQYVGSYKLNDQLYIDVKREGESLMARITGQPAFEIFPESEQKFFWKVTNAQITFAADGSGMAQSATLHQYGFDMPLVRVDASASAAAQQTLDARVQSQTPSPGSEAAIRRTIQAAEQGRINYEDMEPILADVTRKQEEGITASMKQMGAMKSITFKGVGDQGWDVYEVKFAKGTLNYRISMAPNGKIAGMFAIPLP
jgi:beta-lactamase regulating signal transducer with metallopeptidase domain